jgi:hypothetical protein
MGNGGLIFWAKFRTWSGLFRVLGIPGPNQLYSRRVTMDKDYLEHLYELREMLRVLLRKDFLNELVTLAEFIDKSYVDSYNRILQSSTQGKNCGYAAKAKELYVKLQDAPIAEKIKYIYKTFIEEKR